MRLIDLFLRECLENRFQVVQATGLCRPIRLLVLMNTYNLFVARTRSQVNRCCWGKPPAWFDVNQEESNNRDGTGRPLKYAPIASCIQ
jgi:hypothetical protein